MSHGSPRFTRRRLLALAAAAGVSACSRPEVRGQPGASPATASPSPSPRPVDPSTDPRRELADRLPADPAPAPSLPPPEPFEPIADETYPNAKRIAGRAVQHLTTYDRGADYAAVVAQLASEASHAAEAESLAAAATPLHHPEHQSTGEVVYAQLGGLAPWTNASRCSIMVVVRQRLQDEAGEVSAHTRTVDVRLDATGGDWAVERLGDVGGEPVARPDDLSADAAAVVDDERIDLPDSARWDIFRGDVDDRLLAVMRAMADHTPYSVCCLVSGHPVHVFGTDNVSNHAFGMAVDIWAVDGTPVVVDQPDVDSGAHRLARAVFDERVVPSIGGPWAFDGQGGRSFADPVHIDHLHVAYHASRESRAGFRPN